MKSRVSSLLTWFYTLLRGVEVVNQIRVMISESQGIVTLLPSHEPLVILYFVRCGSVE